MPTYVYETLPQRDDEPAERFELRQSMTEPPLTHHPETGQPVRRVVVGGTGPMKSSGSASGGSCCRGSCAC